MGEIIHEWAEDSDSDDEEEDKGKREKRGSLLLTKEKELVVKDNLKDLNYLSKIGR